MVWGARVIVRSGTRIDRLCVIVYQKTKTFKTNKMQLPGPLPPVRPGAVLNDIVFLVVLLFVRLQFPQPVQNVNLGALGSPP